MTNFVKNRKAKAMLVLLAFSTTVAQAQDFRQIINDALNDYLVPFVLLGLLIGVIIGLFRNWNEVNNKDTRKEGLFNVGVILLYAGLCIAVLAGAAAAFSGFSLNI